jgi:hypothetical protein
MTHAIQPVDHVERSRFSQSRRSEFSIRAAAEWSQLPENIRRLFYLVSLPFKLIVFMLVDGWSTTEFIWEGIPHYRQ